MAYESKLKSAMIDDLFRAILCVKDEEECYRFFEDLCTIGELQAMSQRWRVAKMLTENRTYTDIIRETGISTATISRVKKCLHYGADGYQIVLGRYFDKEKSD